VPKPEMIFIQAKPTGP